MKSKSPSIPDSPPYQNHYGVNRAIDFQYNTGVGLTSGDFSNLGPNMMDTINVSPLVSQYSQQLAQSQLDPAFRVRQQDMINQLEANNQLTGSTTASSLGNLNADYMASLTGMQAQYGLADVNRALQNRVQLYGMGLNSVNASGAQSLEAQNQMNQFALANYENQVASALMADKSSGSLLGGGIGALGGAIAGTVMSGGNPLGIAAGAALGGFTGYNMNNPTGAAIAGGLAQGGGYALGSKYASPGSIYGGRESIINPSTSFIGGSGLNSQSVGLQNPYGARSSFGYGG